MKTYNDKVHFWGRVTLLICCIGATLVPIGIGAVYNADVNWGTVIACTISPLITYTISSVIGLLALVPVIGGGALYVANVTGNVNNVKGPAAINGMDICEVEPGTEAGDTVSMISVCVSSIVSTFIMILGVIFLAPIFRPIYESAFFAPAFNVVLPAMYGALLTPYFMKSIKDNIVPFIIPIAAYLILGSAFYSKYSSYIMLIMMVVAVIYVYLLHKNDIQEGKKGTGAEKQG